MDGSPGDVSEERKKGWGMSFYNLSVTLPTSQRILQPFHPLHTSQLILQPFRCFTYVAALSPTLLSLLRHLVGRPWYKEYLNSSYSASKNLFLVYYVLDGSAKCVVCIPRVRKWHIVSLLGDVTSPTTAIHYVSMSSDLRVLSTEKHCPVRRQHTVYTRVYSARGKYIVRHWTSREASLRHSSGWGTWSIFPHYRDLRTCVLSQMNI